MCVSIKAPSIPTPEPIPAPPANTLANATTKQNAPAYADASGRNVNVASSASRRRTGRGSLRIPLSSLGTSSGLNLPSA